MRTCTCLTHAPPTYLNLECWASIPKQHPHRLRPALFSFMCADHQQWFSSLYNANKEAFLSQHPHRVKCIKILWNNFCSVWTVILQFIHVHKNWLHLTMWKNASVTINYFYKRRIWTRTWFFTYYVYVIYSIYIHILIIYTFIQSAE